MPKTKEELFALVDELRKRGVVQVNLRPDGVDMVIAPNAGPGGAGRPRLDDLGVPISPEVKS